MLFSNLKVPENPELELLIELRYGPPTFSEEFINRLPDGVITILYEEFFPPPNPFGFKTDKGKREYLIRFSWALDQNPDKIRKALLKYHSILGRV